MSKKARKLVAGEEARAQRRELWEGEKGPDSLCAPPGETGYEAVENGAFRSRWRHDNQVISLTYQVFLKNQSKMTGDRWVFKCLFRENIAENQKVIIVIRKIYKIK